MSKRSEQAECPRGWRRLACDIVGRPHAGAESLFSVLARPIGAHEAWDRASLDALWEDAHRDPSASDATA